MHTWIGAEELAPHLIGHDDVAKILVTADDTPVDEDGYHVADHVLVLEQDAARMLAARPRFGSLRHLVPIHGSSTPSQRPIHRILFERAVILEYLDLRGVPPGRYLLSAFPVRFAGATESPVTPVLFTAEELG